MLRWTREALGNRLSRSWPEPIIENQTGDVVHLYRQQMDCIVQASAASRSSFRLLAYMVRSRKKKPPSIKPCARDIRKCWLLNLGTMFAPNGEIFDEETVRRLMDIPEIKGMKHSSLDRLVELERLALRDAHRPDFRIYTGNDLGINMIEYGSDYLLGLASFAPEKFAERDRLWEAGDPAYYALSDALQYLGNVAFRDAGSRLQTLGGGVSASDRANSHGPGPSEKSTTPSLGSGNAAGLCAQVGL